MSKSISFRLRFTLLIERVPLKHRRGVFRMANEILVLIKQDEMIYSNTTTKKTLKRYDKILKKDGKCIRFKMNLH